MRRIAIAGLLLLTLAVPAQARAGLGSGDSGGGVVNGSIWAGVQFTTPPSGSGGGDGSGCTWKLASPHDAGIGNEGSTITKLINGITYTLYERSCAGSSVYLWVPSPSDAQLGQQASNIIVGRLPAPIPRTAPPGPAGVVNVGMWFWTETGPWSPVSVTAWVPTPTGVLWARTTAQPTRLVYHSGDPTLPTITCTGPGAVWTASIGDDPWTSCMMIYGHAGSYGASLDIEWSVNWTSSRGATGSLGTHVTSAPVPVEVEEIQALVTS